MNLIQTIIKYLRPFKKMVYLLAFLAMLEAVIAVYIPLLYGQLVDQALKNKPLITISITLIIWLILYLFKDWFSRIVNRYSDNLAAQVATNMTIDYTDHFFHLPVTYLKEQKIGKIISSFTRSSMQINRIIKTIIFSLLPELITIIFILVMLVMINWLLSLMLLVILIIYAIMIASKAKRIAKMGKIIHKAYTTAYGEHYEYLSSYATVKSFSAEDSAVLKLRTKFQQTVSAGWNNSLVWNNLDIWQGSIFAFGFVSLFGVGILMLRSGELTAGNLVTFIGYIFFTLNVLGKLGWYYSTYNEAEAEVSETNKIYKVQTESDIRHDKLIEITDIQGRIRFRNVSFKYQGKDQSLVLNNITFDVKPGEVIALVGGSGAGKSTLVDLISGYYLPTKGLVIIDDLSSQMIDAKSLRRQIAIVPQEVSLFHDSIANNIAYGKQNATREHIENMARAANAHEFIIDFPQGYQSKVGERGVKLSVGQKQRIAIARALLRDPKILILDEATSAMDSITENLVQEALKRLITGRTTFIIAHRLSTIVHADRIFVLDGGKIVEIGNHRELIQKNGMYKKLYDAQKFNV